MTVQFDADLSRIIARARSHTLGDLLSRSAARYPDKVAIAYAGLRQTYAGLNDTVNRTAHAMVDRGIEPGDRIAVLSHNSYAYAVLMLAISRAGAISVPVNFMLNATEVAYILQHSGAQSLIVEDALRSVAEAAEAMGSPLKIRALICERDERMPAGWDDIRGWLEHSDSTPIDLAAGDDAPVQIMYTSGTESRPKGATLSARNLISQYVSCIVDGDMAHTDIDVHSLPLYHCAQQHCFLMPDIYLGATSIVLPAPDPAAILATIERERATKLFCPPTVWISLLNHPDFSRRDLSSLRKGYYGASIMPAQLIKRLLGAIPHLRLYNFYGQTEMSPVATVLGPDEQLSKLGTAGKASLHVETQIVDDNDRPVPPGTVGEIVHRGPHVTLGYWNDPERTRAAFRGGWFHSGDLGTFDEAGYLMVVDRKKDMIKTGGENVSSREVEEVLYTHPAVAETAVFGLPHETWIEAVTAAVVLRDGAAVAEESLIQHCRERLAGYKTPKRVYVVQQLPKNASGKILKRELRQQFIDRQ